VLREMLQIDQAVHETEQAIAIATSVRSERRSSLAEALLTAGELLTLVERREKDVITYLEQFLQITRRPLGVDVTWSRVYEMLGDAYFRVGRYEDAVTAYNAVLQFNPYHPWEISIYYRIGRAYYFHGNYAKSVDAIQHALRIAETDGHELDYHLYDIYGNAYFALKRYDKAAEAYAAALRLAPTNSTHNENLEKLRKYHQFSLDMLQGTF
jgi:tetratricopeptide (TPR) repeat protein